MYTYDYLLSELNNTDDREKIQEIGKSPLLVEHELLHVTYALLAKKHNLPSPNLRLSSLASGAVPLFRRSLLPWGGLPYPKEHALLGTLLAQLDVEAMQKVAREMIHYQQATLDHDQNPITSLFSQEKEVCADKINEANRAFFDAITLTSPQEQQFMDYEIGMLSKKTERSTVICVASGCKSGLGAFLVKDVGVLNFGPQLLPVGDCSGFGLAGRGQKIQLKEEAGHFSLSYLCRLASPSLRETGLAHLQDSGYSALWMECAIEANQHSLNLQGQFDGFRPLGSLVFTVFGKGEGCKVAGSHKLSPRSLDRYQGPAQSLEFTSDQASVCFEITKGAAHMEVIPLAGDRSFWGADFLAAFRLTDPSLTLSIHEMSDCA